MKEVQLVADLDEVASEMKKIETHLMTQVNAKFTQQSKEFRLII